MIPDITLNQHSVKLAEHQGRIEALEYTRDRAVENNKALTEKLDALKLWMMSTMAAALAGLIAQLVHGH